METLEQQFCLCVNGGGSRGIGAATILHKIKEQVASEDSNAGQSNTKRNIAEIFREGMTGVSTGALIVLALAAKKDVTVKNSEPLFSTQEVVKFYEEHTDGIFSCWSYSNCIHNIQGCYHNSCNTLHCSKNCCCQCASATALIFSLLRLPCAIFQ